jgi:deoxyribodipyrimidine photolyase-related protein
MCKLRLILGDQLNYNHSWYSEKNQEDKFYLLIEMRQETDYTLHHIQKIVGFFSAMRNFANHLIDKKLNVIYLKINDTQNCQDLEQNIIKIIQEKKCLEFQYQLPDEYRLDVILNKLSSTLKIPIKVFDTEHFLSQRLELKEFFSGKKQIIMESFYRYKRKKESILMKGEDPLGGKWNFDHDNRKPFKGSTFVPNTELFYNNVKEVYDDIVKCGCKYFGEIESNKFIWPVSKIQCNQLLSFFIEEMLQNFGTYQDAMDRDNWNLFHSRLSFAMNTKMLSPKEVVDAAVAYYLKNEEKISISQIEGFVRQIVGWREYMRGIYWWKMPEFSMMNFFNHENKLPEWFWTGNTKMSCLSHSIKQSLKYAYAHHIQRLMVTGNFLLLAMINPDEIDEWYLGIYIDAIEWVEITNTRGMSQFADGGIVGTKPYVSSANYINKMSNYCKGCYYDSTKRYGEKACPFNSLYWNFYATHKDKLAKNPRIGMSYVTWNKMQEEEQKLIINQAKKYLFNINQL